MFNWVWDLLYGISKSIFSIIDGLLSCANMLCGIEPIKYQGAEMDFMTFLLRNKNISYAFIGAVMVGVVLVVIFAIFAILRSMASEKDSMTPTQIYVKVGKTMLTFIFIPVAMAVLIYFTNVLMQTLYKATLGGSPDGLGRFLAGAFGQDCRKGGVPENFYLSSDFNYKSTSNMREYVNLNDYDFFFSWIAGIAILLSLASSILMFVDRAIALVILFIASPISLSTSVLDDGQRFKLWRDQFLVKFLTGYGCIIGLNIYALVVAAITTNDLVFFENGTLNDIMKIAIIVGGSVSMNRLMALVGNLISQGAGSNELRDNAIATSQARGAIGRFGSAALAPFRATRSAANFVRDSRQFGTLSAIGQRLGFNTDRSYGKMSAVQKSQTHQNLVESEKYKRSLSNKGEANKVENAIHGPNNGGGGNGGAGAAGSNINPGGKGNANNNIGNKMIENNILNNKNNDKK
ncbi:MAG: hypothetical protein IJU60_03200 [Acholeplasmatales bacterium]|nr:hypothetical protein [Acholeplasmatales bacterium]